jgi:hypothetical protein
MRVKVIYKCNLQDCPFNGTYELECEGGPLTDQDGLHYRELAKHLALHGGAQHFITLWGCEVTPPAPVSPNGRFVQGR